MEVIIDSNFLFRVLISGGCINDIIFSPKISLFTPNKLFEEFSRHKEELIRKSRLSEPDFDFVSSVVLARISIVPELDYAPYLPRAKELLKGHDKDEAFVAAALFKGCKIWAYEARLFEIGLAVSTKEISSKLSKEA